MGTHPSIQPKEIEAAVTRLASAIATRHAGNAPLLLLGIANGGMELARRLAALLAASAPGRAVKVGTLDISFHRDDLDRHPIPKEFAPTQVPADVDGAHVILVDDVLFSGRTVKAALDELFDHGRPARAELAVLVDRGGRRLPLAADYVGLTVAASEREKVVVHLDPSRRSRDSVQVLPAAARPTAG